MQCLCSFVLSDLNIQDEHKWSQRFKIGIEQQNKRRTEIELTPINENFEKSSMLDKWYNSNEAINKRNYWHGSKMENQREKVLWVLEFSTKKYDHLLMMFSEGVL